LTVVYALAGGSGFVFDSLISILVGRALPGLAVAGITVTVTALITDYYDDDTHKTILGRQAAFMAFGGVLFLPLSGILADVGWRFPFLIYTGSLLLLPAMVLSLPEPERAETTGDRPTSLAALRQSLSRLPLGTLDLVYFLALAGRLIFYMIAVQGPFYLESQTKIDATTVGFVLGVSTLAGGIVSLGYGPYVLA
jgi:MFS family permease